MKYLKIAMLASLILLLFIAFANAQELQSMTGAVVSKSLRHLIIRGQDGNEYTFRIGHNTVYNVGRLYGGDRVRIDYKKHKGVWVAYTVIALRPR